MGRRSAAYDGAIGLRFEVRNLYESGSNVLRISSLPSVNQGEGRSLWVETMRHYCLIRRLEETQRAVALFRAHPRYAVRNFTMAVRNLLPTELLARIKRE